MTGAVEIKEIECYIARHTGENGIIGRYELLWVNVADKENPESHLEILFSATFPLVNCGLLGP